MSNMEKDKTDKVFKNKKSKIDKQRLNHIIINFLTYFAVFLIKDEESTIFTILVLIPVVLVINSFIYGFRARGCDIIYSSLSALLFIPFIYIKSSKILLVYSLMYLAFMMITNVLGFFLSNFRKIPDDEKDIACNCKWTL